MKIVDWSGGARIMQRITNSSRSKDDGFCKEYTCIKKCKECVCSVSKCIDNISLKSEAFDFYVNTKNAKAIIHTTNLLLVYLTTQEIILYSGPNGKLVMFFGACLFG